MFVTEGCGKMRDGVLRVQGDPNRRRQRASHKRTVGYRGEVNEEHTVPVEGSQSPCSGDRHRCLPDASWTGNSRDASFRLLCNKMADEFFATNDRAWLYR